MDGVRVVIADDLALVRQGIRALLTPLDGVEIVGEGANADDAVSLARSVKPDVVLIDQNITGDGLRATHTIKEDFPHIEVIIMTDRLDEAKALRAIEAGATGYILKDIPVTNLAAALKSVCNGRAFFHPQVTRKLFQRLSSLVQEQRTRTGLEAEGLTPRELDVIVEMAKGSTDREIAAKFVVTEGTVKTHIHRILRKLGARNRTQAVAYVLRNGFIS